MSMRSKSHPVLLDALGADVIVAAGGVPNPHMFFQGSFVLMATPGLNLFFKVTTFSFTVVAKPVLIFASFR